MLLKTTRFGEVEVGEDAIITLTQPIIGFQEYRRFVLFDGPPDSGLKWLQSTDSPELAFLLFDPRQVVPDYTVDIGRHELTELAVSSVSELDVYTLLVVPKDPSKVRTNLKAPVLINGRHRLGKQTVLEKSDYPIQFFLAQANQGTREPKEAANARTDS